jgi:hypothetical protein
MGAGAILAEATALGASATKGGKDLYIIRDPTATQITQARYARTQIDAETATAMA